MKRDRVTGILPKKFGTDQELSGLFKVLSVAAEQVVG